MKKFKYETHLHTMEASACASSHGFEYIKAYKDFGYSGIIVTDHFFGGNTCISYELSWEERISQFCSGYEKALEASKNDPDFKVFFGFEQTFQGDDYLIYGLDKQWLLNHPEIDTMNHQQLFEAVNSVNGLMIQAHPFRLRGYMNAIHIHPREVHGVEIFNAGNKPEENELAKHYAALYNFPVTSGSDIHNIDFIRPQPGKNPVGGMEFDTPLESIFDYAQRIRLGKGRLIK